MEEWEREKRPDPKALLSNAQEEHRGKLKLFLGSAPGVGKTFAMLTEAQEKRRENIDVVVGWVDTHKRRETEALLQGLEVIPRLSVEVKGYTYEHLDVKAIIKRRPVTVVIDEMPHANPPGAHHAKRWQDIEEILDVGINVYSALNIQHLESLNGVVSRVTGVQVSETIPDSVFDRADEVRLVDLPPDDLILRLEAGKIYLPEVVSRARNNYFKRSNLIALRDLTLRAMASRIDSEIKLNRLSSSSRTVEDTSFGILLVLEDIAYPDGIRETARMARALASPWHCVWIGEIEKQLSSEAIELLQFAHDLGATTDNLGGNFCSTIRDYVRDHNLSLVVFLQSPSLFALWRRHKLTQEAPELKFMTLNYSKRPWSWLSVLRHNIWPHKANHHSELRQGAFDSGNVTLALGSSKVAAATIKTERISYVTHAKAAAAAASIAAANAAAEAELSAKQDQATIPAPAPANTTTESTNTSEAQAPIDSPESSAVDRQEALSGAEPSATTKLVAAVTGAPVLTQAAEAATVASSNNSNPASNSAGGSATGNAAAPDSSKVSSNMSSSSSAGAGAVTSGTGTPSGLLKGASSPLLESDEEDEAKGRTLRRVRGILLVLGCNFLMTAALLPLSSFLEPTNLVMFYLLITLFIAVRYGYTAAIISSVVSLLCFDLTMVHPIGSFAIEDLQYLITFVAMLVIGLTSARLVSHRQSMAREARKRESQNRMLYDAARYLSVAIDEDAVYSVISRIFLRGMHITMEFWHYYDEDNEIVRKQVVLKNVDEAIVRWCLERKKPAGMGTHTLNQSAYLYVPLLGSERPLGVVVLKLHNKGQWTNPSSYRLVQGLITLTAQAIDRLESVDEARQTLMNMEAERLRHSLIQSLSHDLRTPLTAILANAENLNHKLKNKEGNSTEALNDSEELVVATQRMVRLMNNVLEMAKLQTDKLVLNKQWIPAEELIGMARNNLKERLKNFKLKIEIEPDCPPLYGDVVLLDRLLSNLLDNATKYCPQGSTIIIECKRRADKIGLAVIDNGPGIHTDNPQRLFDPFKRGQKESKVVGIGLGLAICKTIARVHNADLFVLPSRLGGACFMLALPYEPLPELEEDEELMDNDALEPLAPLEAPAASAAAVASESQDGTAATPEKPAAPAAGNSPQAEHGSKAAAPHLAQDSKEHHAGSTADALRKNSYLREFGIAADPHDYSLRGATSSGRETQAATAPAPQEPSASASSSPNEATAEAAPDGSQT